LNVDSCSETGLLLLISWFIADQIIHDIIHKQKIAKLESADVFTLASE
jgi:hypothetical protein